MLSQVQSQKQLHKILPQQIELLHFLHLNSLELEQRIQDEINDNPMLEEMNGGAEDSADKFSKESVQDFQGYEEYAYDDIPDYKMEYKNYLPAETIPDRPLADTVDFREDLKKQCRFVSLPEEQYVLLDFLIDSLNDNGFLEQDAEALATEFSFRNKCWMEAGDVSHALNYLKELEPVGVGARDARECLLIQLKGMNTKRPDVKMAIRLLEDFFPDLRSCNMEKIKHALQLEEDEVRIIIKLIATLKTKPVTESTGVNNSIIPDFVIQREGEVLEASLFRQRSSSLHISQSWVEKVQSVDHDHNTDKATRQYLRNKLSAAQWFISAIELREANMMKVMRAIVAMQEQYFLTGDIMLLKPMILKNIADKVGLDISTVSRITCNKYAETPFGTILLKDLFSEGLLNKEGDNISNKVIQNTIEDVIKAEDKHKPYTDKELVAILSAKGYEVARRTVAKYRNLLKIPVSQMRGIWA
ncbi:MAG TPA: RNA polymerase factor sigma-54 [Chitinophagaceae bacterium]|nr:RNA polymerase factor sigma-54 [Chitinophagaceae bacterium]